MKSSIAEVRRGFLRTAVCLGAVFGSMLASHPVCAYETGGPGDGEFVISDEERARIAEALPEKAPAVPGKPRKLLIFDLNVVYGGHPSRFYANWAFQEMGRKTGAFEAVISRDPAVFEKVARPVRCGVSEQYRGQPVDPALRRNLRNSFMRAAASWRARHQRGILELGRRRWR